MNSVIANPDQFAIDPKKDFTRHRNDFIEYSSLAHIRLLSVSPGSLSAIPTNVSWRTSQGKNFLPKGSRPLYHRRWSVLSSFRKLKYTIDLSNYHSYKSKYIKQEIWANLIAYNKTEMVVNCAVIEKRKQNMGTKWISPWLHIFVESFSLWPRRKTSTMWCFCCRKNWSPYGMNANTQNYSQLISVSHDTLSIG